MSEALFAGGGSAAVQMELHRAQAVRMPIGPYQGMTLGEIVRAQSPVSSGVSGRDWLQWFLGEGIKSAELKRAVERVLRE